MAEYMKADMEEVVKMAMMLSKLPRDARIRLSYMIEGAALVTTVECPPAETA